MYMNNIAKPSQKKNNNFAPKLKRFLLLLQQAGTHSTQVLSVERTFTTLPLKA